MLTVRGGIAEFERDLILQRTDEGRARARLADHTVVDGRAWQETRRSTR
jgi:DNA invertase Pin-like site-specific DNA recombinase